MTRGLSATLTPTHTQKACVMGWYCHSQLLCEKVCLLSLQSTRFPLCPLLRSFPILQFYASGMFAFHIEKHLNAKSPPAVFQPMGAAVNGEERNIITVNLHPTLPLKSPLTKSIFSFSSSFVWIPILQ